jgi:hypothetical protein
MLFTKVRVCYTFFAVAVSLMFAASPLIAQGGEIGSITCEDFAADLEQQLSSLNTRLETFAKTPSSLSSDYYTWQERRIGWQEIQIPDCAAEIHPSIISMYANLGDIAAIGLWLEHNPESNSGNRLVQEAITRADVSVQKVADQLSELTGNLIDTSDVSASLNAIAVRFDEG